MPPRVVVVDHHDSYTFNLVHLIAGVAGEVPAVVQHDEVEADALLGGEFTHVVLSPGPGHPDIEADFAVGREVLSRAELPVLGVCLGMQGLVSVYGGRVDQIEPAHGEVALIEHCASGLFEGVPQRFEAVRYHSLAAVKVPDVLDVIARSRDGVVMGVRHRDLPLWGVQFHPESILTRHGARLVGNFLEVRS
ncbi:MAG: aminodeoxychorismate/anthranilate synthase component II [Propionibacteriales bacterium]|nr:aminodeoxychorismate/anthranilate synthase component II [Propionibacteriales bacterium]